MGDARKSRSDLIDAMLAQREKLLEAPLTPDARVLYYPPRLVDRARIFWAGSYRIEPIEPIPLTEE